MACWSALPAGDILKLFLSLFYAPEMLSLCKVVVIIKNIPELQDKLLGICSYGWFVIVARYMFRYTLFLYVQILFSVESYHPERS